MKKYLFIIALILGGCSLVKDATLGALTGSSGGLEVSPSIEVIDGDKQQTIETSANKMETIVEATTVEEVSNNKMEAGQIYNSELSGWTVFLIASGYVLSLIFLCLPTPTNMWRAWKNRRH